jgi:hypothetical protein
MSGVSPGEQRRASPTRMGDVQLRHDGSHGPHIDAEVVRRPAGKDLWGTIPPEPCDEAAGK